MRSAQCVRWVSGLQQPPGGLLGRVDAGIRSVRTSAAAKQNSSRRSALRMTNLAHCGR